MTNDENEDRLIEMEFEAQLKEIDSEVVVNNNEPDQRVTESPVIIPFPRHPIPEGLSEEDRELPPIV